MLYCTIGPYIGPTACALTALSSTEYVGFTSSQYTGVRQYTGFIAVFGLRWLGASTETRAGGKT